MSQNGLSPFEMRITGIVRGVDIDRSALVMVGADALTIDWLAASPWVLSYDGLDGVVSRSDVVTLYLHGGDVLELRSAEQAGAFAARLVPLVHALPELTRGLRSLGSLRGSPGAAHDRWFEPLLSSRRAVVAVSDPIAQADAFDASRLRAEFERAIAEIAAVNAPSGGALQRALEAALEEEAEPVFAAITSLGASADQLRASGADSRLIEWRRWVDQLRRVFAVADERWPGCAAALRE